MALLWLQQEAKSSTEEIGGGENDGTLAQAFLKSEV